MNAKNLEKKLYFIVSLMIASNAYFVQRVISRVDMTTAEVSGLKEQVARIETHLEDMSQGQPAKWKKL